MLRPQALTLHLTLCSAGNRTQSYVNAKQVHGQLSYISSPSWISYSSNSRFVMRRQGIAHGPRFTLTLPKRLLCDTGLKNRYFLFFRVDRLCENFSKNIRHYGNDSLTDYFRKYWYYIEGEKKIKTKPPET